MAHDSVYANNMEDGNAAAAVIVNSRKSTSRCAILSAVYGGSVGALMIYGLIVEDSIFKTPENTTITANQFGGKAGWNPVGIIQLAISVIYIFVSIFLWLGLKMDEVLSMARFMCVSAVFIGSLTFCGGFQIYVLYSFHHSTVASLALVGDILLIVIVAFNAYMVQRHFFALGYYPWHHLWNMGLWSYSTSVVYVDNSGPGGTAVARPVHTMGFNARPPYAKTTTTQPYGQLYA